MRGKIEERYRGLVARLVLSGKVTGEAVGIVEFLLPHRLVPPHRHVTEDEVSYVLDGEVGFRVGDETTTGGPGACVYKPLGVMDSFWNASDREARILEVIVPGGAERGFFTDAPPGPARGPNMHSDEWVAGLKQRYGLKLLGE